MKIVRLINSLLLLFAGLSAYAQEPSINRNGRSEWPKHMHEADTLDVYKEYEYKGKTYQIGRLLLEDAQLGPLILRVSENNRQRDHMSEPIDYPELSRVELIKLKGRPFFFVIDRYHLFLVDIEAEKIAPSIRPGKNVEYGEDALSGVMEGFQFFNDDNYLLGIAVNYGLFCFNIADIDHPKELFRYSAKSSDQGQPYLFIEQNANGRWTGIVSQSDTSRKSKSVSGFYTATTEAKFLFQDASLSPPEELYVDPITVPRPYLLLRPSGRKHNRPSVIDLKRGILLNGKRARAFLTKHP